MVADLGGVESDIAAGLSATDAHHCATAVGTQVRCALCNNANS